MAAACDSIRAAIAAGKRICVHGDYDVDGICATALAVLILRELGADVEWHLPSRFEEGYGVARETLARLASEDCGLVVTVDCGITAVAEIAEAKAAGLDVIVTDHHRPGETLPDCLLVATRPSDYPFPELCGTGVVYKLGQALLGRDSPVLERHLDLVALATIADVVPLVDENRALAIAGLRALARTQKPGLRALMEAARVDPAAVDEGAVGFRLGPRINAAGRLCRPSEALELLLTDDKDEARRLAERLEALNRDRQAVEQRILREAVAQVEEWPEARRAAARLRDRRRGLARRRDRDRRVASRRAIPPAGRPARGWRRRVEGLGPVDSRLRPARRARRLLGPARALGRPPGGGRAERGARAARGLREAFAAHADAQLDDADLEPVDVRRRRRLAARADARAGRRARRGWRRSGSATRACVLLLAGCEIAEPATVGEGQPPALPRPRPRPRRGQCDRLRDGRPPRPVAARRRLRRRVPARGEPLERHRCAAARRAARLRHERALPRLRARASPTEWRKPRGGEKRRGPGDLHGARPGRATARPGAACSSRRAFRALLDGGRERRGDAEEPPS